MTPRQIIIGDELLRYLDSKGGQWNKDSYQEYLTEKGFTKPEYLQVIRLLQEYDLVKFLDPDEYTLGLQPNAYKAIKMGLMKWIDLPEKRRRQNMFYLSLTFILGILTLLITLITHKIDNGATQSNEKRDPKTEKNTNNHNNTTSKQQNLHDNIFINVNEITDSLKHDSLNLPKDNF
jgi:hypothetical protein